MGPRKPSAARAAHLDCQGMLLMLLMLNAVLTSFVINVIKGSQICLLINVIKGCQICLLDSQPNSAPERTGASVIHCYVPSPPFRPFFPTVPTL